MRSKQSIDTTNCVVRSPMRAPHARRNEHDAECAPTAFLFVGVVDLDVEPNGPNEPESQLALRGRADHLFHDLAQHRPPGGPPTP